MKTLLLLIVVTAFVVSGTLIIYVIIIFNYNTCKMFSHGKSDFLKKCPYLVRFIEFIFRIMNIQWLL